MSFEGLSMGEWYESSYGVPPASIYREGEFVFEYKTKMEVIEGPNIDLLDVYPYPTHIRDMSIEGVPPYWKNWLAIRPRDDNIGILGV